ncbi:MAG TPA: nodulation protein NfeD [Actinomycetota bacterium]|nr:nodulation protein NfeD [Actinomycetota bacterium]
MGNRGGRSLGRSRVRRMLALTLLGFAGLALATPAADAQGQLTGSVVQLELDGVVDPFVADYIEEQIAAAQEQGALAVLLTIDTPGGLDSAMRQITQAILNAGVPVIGYVFPEGARAASAGTFILLSSHIAAMAPATNVGAAQPVGISGAVASEKAVNDAAEYIVSIAERQGRNAEWAESAVREAESISAEEALEIGVIDLIAPDVATLLAEVDGMSVTVAGGQEVTLDLEGATIREVDPGFFVNLLHTLLDPNLAFIFFWLGLALIAIEFFVPGGVAGTLGVIMFVLSLVALGMLPVQLIGVVLLIASIVFFALELLHPGVGLPAIAGIVCVVLGGLFLFDTSVPGVSVSPLVIVPVALFAGFFFLIVVRKAIALRRLKVTSRDELMVGREGTVVRDLDPAGVVQVAAEEWSATSVRGTQRRGDRVRVVEMEGLRLKVEPVEEPATASTEGREP